MRICDELLIDVVLVFVCFDVVGRCGVGDSVYWCLLTVDVGCVVG